MLFLFSLINISFTFFFFLFGKYLESVLFGIISILFIVYFSKILSFFLEKEEEDDHHQTKSHHAINTGVFLRELVGFLKKWSYYISFSLFYISLYGFIYSLNLVYNLFNPSEIFEYLTLAISCIITFIFFVFRSKNHETIFLIFRSNGIVFTFFYTFLIFFYFFTHQELTFFFIVNTLFPLTTLVSVIVFDPFFREKKKYLYILFLVYLFLIGWYYSSLIFTGISLWYNLLLALSSFMIVYTFGFPYIRVFSSFRRVSETAGIYMSYMLSLLTIIFLIGDPLSGIIFFIFMVLVAYDYVIYRLLGNLVSYVLLLLSVVVLYVKIALSFGLDSLFSYSIFIFLLPYVLIGINYIISVWKQKSLYIIHSLWIFFSIGAIVYYYTQIWVLSDILGLSTLFFFESILLFMSYIQLKK